VYSLSPSVTFTAEALQQLEAYPWPGNIRELENAVVRAAAMCDGAIRVQDLPERVSRHKTEGPQPPMANLVDKGTGDSTEWVTLSEIEGRYVSRVLAHTRGNKQAAARLLGVDRKTVERILRRQDPNNSSTAGGELIHVLETSDV
jgi:DNA-binding NtrC family response regulator